MPAPWCGYLTGLSKPTSSQLRPGESTGLVLATGTTEAGLGRVPSLRGDPTAAYAAGRRHARTDPGRRRRRHGPRRRPVRTATPGRRAAAGSAPVVQQVTDALDGAATAPGLARADVHRLGIVTPGAFEPGHRPPAQRLPPAQLELPHVLDEHPAALPTPFAYGTTSTWAPSPSSAWARPGGTPAAALLRNHDGLIAALVPRAACTGAGPAARARSSCRCRAPPWSARTPGANAGAYEKPACARPAGLAHSRRPWTWRRPCCAAPAARTRW
ncbi:hypothetical protein SHIRM173S_07850 [Streptomyces hirsutus]